KYRAGEAQGHAFQATRVITAAVLQQRPGRDPEAASAVQDRLREAGLVRAARVGVQGVVIPAEPVDECGLWDGPDIAYRIRFPFRGGIDLLILQVAAAETAVATRHRSGSQRTQQRIVCQVIDVALGAHQGADLRALVEDPGHPGLAQYG